MKNYNITCRILDNMPCKKFTEKIDYYKKIRKQKKLFGTFGFRGIVDKGITAQKVYKVGAALSLYLGKGKTIAIGKDPRVSSDMLEDALINGITEHGCNAISLGILTPNALSLEINRQADAGVMITASHNPPEYNGIKCLNEKGIGFSPEQDIALERLYFSDINKTDFKGKKFTDNKAIERYHTHIINYIEKLFSQKSMRIVVDCGGGSASAVTPHILKKIGHEVIKFNCEFDGMFKKRNPEPLDKNLQELKKLVKQESADFGVAHDGDGDRTAFIDENGNFIQGDVSAAIISDHIIQQKNSKNKLIAVTIAYSNIIEDIADSIKAKVIYTPVGEPYLAQAKLQCGAELGLEEHGSVLLEWSREGPMLAGVMSGILSKTEMSLSELVDSYPKYYQIKDAVNLPENTNTDKLLEKIKQEIHGYQNLTDIDGIRANYSDGWFLIRASGTEPKIRVFSEAKTQKRAKELNQTGINIVKEATL